MKYTRPVLVGFIPTLQFTNKRKENYLGIGHKDLSNFEDWKYAITLIDEYGDGEKSEEFITSDFNEVLNYVNKEK